jgi:hypothetical protein
MDDQQKERFEAAVERKKRDAEAASRNTAEADGQSPVSGDEASLYEHGRPQDTLDPRAKNAGHGKKTADKWNQ